MPSTVPNRTIIRVTREFAFSGLGSPLYVVVDEVMLGKASLNKPCDFQVSPGEHQIYIRGGKAAFSNALDIDLLEGSVAAYGCRWDLSAIKSQSSFAIGMGGAQPKEIALYERSH
jgi:hypothetical protein